MRTIAMLLTLTFALSFSPISRASEQLQYDPDDVKAIQSFLRQDNGIQSNAELLGWDINDPSTWVGVRWWIHDPKPQKVFSIWITDSEITNFKLSSLARIQGIDLSGNQLTDIELSDLPQLGKFNCANNQLSTLSISDLPELANIDCSDNRLTQLTLSNLPSLKFLYCSDNQLSFVETVNCGQWEILQAHDNPLDRAWVDEEKSKVSENWTFGPGTFTYTTGGVNYSLYSYYNSRIERKALLTVKSSSGHVYGSTGYGGMLVYPVPGKGYEFLGWDDLDGLTLYERTMDFMADNICEVISQNDSISLTAVMRPVGENYTENDTARYLQEHGIGKEIGFGAIAPEKPVTRAEYLISLMHVFDGRFHHTDREYRQYFDDIPGSTYCENAALKARELSIIFGVGYNMFYPDMPITKQDMITMTYRAMIAFGLPVSSYENEPVIFSNLYTVSEYAREPMRVLAEHGLIARDVESAKSEVSRAEAAQLIHDILILRTS